MLTKRHLAAFCMASLLAASVTACNPDNKPTVHPARPLSSQPAAIPGHEVVPADGDIFADGPKASSETAADEHAPVSGDGAPAAEDVRFVQPAEIEPAVLRPEGALDLQNGAAGLPPVPGATAWPVPEPPAGEAPRVLPKPYCFGEAMTCDRLNDFGADWFNNCGAQQGCDIRAVCRPRDVLDCANVTDAAQCETQGCTWYTPVPQAFEAPTRRWYDPRRFVDLVDREVIEPAIKWDARLWHMHTGVAAGGAMPPIDDEVMPSICVAPEQKDVAAVCNGLSSIEACQSHDALCVWAPIGCVGTSQPCPSLSSQATCDAQIGCRWGVE